MSRAPFDEAWLDVFAETCARLAAPFADRAAVLWRAGFDEASWTELEARCLDALEAGGASAAQRFASAFGAARRTLADGPPTVQRPEEEATLPWTTLVSPPDDAMVEESAATEPLDLVQAMTTLASSSEPARRARLKRGG